MVLKLYVWQIISQRDLIANESAFCRMTWTEIFCTEFKHLALLNMNHAFPRYLLLLNLERILVMLRYACNAHSPERFPGWAGCITVTPSYFYPSPENTWCLCSLESTCFQDNSTQIRISRKKVQYIVFVYKFSFCIQMLNQG